MGIQLLEHHLGGRVRSCLADRGSVGARRDADPPGTCGGRAANASAAEHCDTEGSGRGPGGVSVARFRYRLTAGRPPDDRLVPPEEVDVDAACAPDRRGWWYPAGTEVPSDPWWARAGPRGRELVRFLKREGPLPQGKAAEQLGLSASAISNLVRRLQEKSLVEARRQGRRKVISVSSEVIP